MIVVLQDAGRGAAATSILFASIGRRAQAVRANEKAGVAGLLRENRSAYFFGASLVVSVVVVVVVLLGAIGVAGVVVVLDVVVELDVLVSGAFESVAGAGAGAGAGVGATTTAGGAAGGVTVFS